MNLNMAQYVEINSIGVILLTIMLFYIVRMHQLYGAAEQTLFLRMLFSNAVILISDIAICAFRGHTGQYMFMLNHICCVVYYGLHGYFGYIWFKYCVTRLFPEQRPNRLKKALIAFPYILAIILSATSPWTGWAYKIDSDNCYSRGPLMWLVIALSFSYYVAAVAITIRDMIRQERNREKSLYMTLLLFPMPTMIAIVVQIMYYGVSLIWISSAVSLLIIYMDLQNTQLSRDMLTGLFNRRQIDAQLNWEINHLRPDCPLFAIMIDVNHFKSINDKFGHIEGDKALIAVAKVLNSSVGYEHFVGRFGGDEFVVVGHAANRSVVEELIERINKQASDCDGLNNVGYKLSLSMGYAMFEDAESITSDTILSEVDRKMYISKANFNRNSAITSS